MCTAVRSVVKQDLFILFHFCFVYDKMETMMTSQEFVVFRTNARAALGSVLLLMFVTELGRSVTDCSTKN